MYAPDRQTGARDKIRCRQFRLVFRLRQTRQCQPVVLLAMRFATKLPLLQLLEEG
jgi:hypothetical protein